MNYSELLMFIKKEYRLVLNIFCLFLFAGFTFYFFQTDKYEVSMLVESRPDTTEAENTSLPWTIKRAVDSGLLVVEAAGKAGLPKAAMPKYGATVCYPGQVVKIYTFVPREEIETSKKGMLALLEVLVAKLPEDHEQYFLDLDGLIKDTQKLDARLKNISANAKSSGLVEKIPGLKNFLLLMQKKARRLQREGRVLHFYGLSVITPPAAADAPASPTLMQILISFGLLGFFSGLAYALWRRPPSCSDEEWQD